MKLSASTVRDVTEEHRERMISAAINTVTLGGLHALVGDLQAASAPVSYLR
ncbi:MAG: hypothetical protein ACRDT5_06945 [Mycobacterium sp.]